MKSLLIFLLIVFEFHVIKTQSGLRCRGRNFDKERCCTKENPCVEGEGDCENDTECGPGLGCGTNNCKRFGDFFHPKDDCCVKIDTNIRCRGRNFDTGRCCTTENPCVEGEGDCENNEDCEGNLSCGNNNCKKFGDFYHEKDDCCIKSGTSQPLPNTDIAQQSFGNIPLDPPEGQRCRGRNYEGKRCCTPEQPCGEGEGDCDGRGDGGLNDGDTGCRGSLVCGSNNCKQFGHYYHAKDDCCEKPNTSKEQGPDFSRIWPRKPLLPPDGQRCIGRNYGERRCCTPEEPCDEGEGDCDGREDGSEHDGNRGCRGDLVCGSNNCKKFGLYYHDKDDCCERPVKEVKKEIASYWMLKLWSPVR
eukprot:GFUD01032752.1.p1 GENE.GFUD01032752.1~~GFUD01032752.1.p1  ORF type:complete len:359 (+),score=66.98 GFUD01032752.1:137-1213(+)